MIHKARSILVELSEQIARFLEDCVAGVRTYIQERIRRHLRKVWEQHRERVNTNTDYAAALAAAAVAAAKLFTDDPALLAVVAALAALYVAIHHATRRGTWKPATDPWGAPGDRWDTGDRWDGGPDWG